MTPYNDNYGLQPPRTAPGSRSLSAASLVYGQRGASLAPMGAPGSFNSDFKSTIGLRNMNQRSELTWESGKDLSGEHDSSQTERLVEDLKEKLRLEIKIKEGSENLLEALHSKKLKQTREQRSRAEAELNSANRTIGELKVEIDKLQQQKEPRPTGRSRMSSLFGGSYLRPTGPNTNVVAETQPQGDEYDERDTETESPTYILAEILLSLEAEGMQADYYVEKANSLVELFKRYPTLKYDLVWSVFGQRVQSMLLSDSREVVAAGYRMTRYAVTDRKSLQIIRELNTDFLVILSLIKESKASVEREQALKFVRAFLDVKDGVRELSRAVVRTIVSIAEYPEDRLRAMCVETLAEIVILDPPLLVAAGGIGPLTEVLAEGSYEASESLVTAFLYLLDTPDRRQNLRGSELDVVFSSFSDSLSAFGNENRIKVNAKVVSKMLNTWPAYGRVANLKTESSEQNTNMENEEDDKRTLLDHYSALLLAVLVETGLLTALLNILESCPDDFMKRKTTLLLGEVLKMANRVLPSSCSAKLQMLPGLFMAASTFGDDDRFVATHTVYQIDSISRTLYRSGSSAMPRISRIKMENEQQVTPRQPDGTKAKAAIYLDEAQFRALMMESGVLNSRKYTKWKWDVIETIVDGPILNPKRLEESNKATNFMSRLIAFYLPSQEQFSHVKNTKPYQRYARIGCILVRNLAKVPEGATVLAEKLLRELLSCLDPADAIYGLSSPSPVFSPSRIAETLAGSYFSFIGALSSEPEGLSLLERMNEGVKPDTYLFSRMFHKLFKLLDLQGRPDLTKKILASLDYTLPSQFRVLLSKCLTTSRKDVRIFATNLLRKYVSSPISSPNPSVAEMGGLEWAIRLLAVQLYDPDVEVCETAVKTLEHACDQTRCLEYVVRCRPALDHLGDIGAPLLLRFLSTSVGYHYLHGLDYIEQEMDNWFLGRNDTYVTEVEASLIRALDTFDKPRREPSQPFEPDDTRILPPHFYRELTRTAEGCRLLAEKGHFKEFVSIISESGMESHDAEIILKVKGCLWAVGNVGSMTLGAPFLEETNVVEKIVRIVENSEVMTLRGTAFFVLGLISRSIHGMEILDEFGWDGATKSCGDSAGLCLPLDLSRLFSIKPWKHITTDHELSAVDSEDRAVPEGGDTVEARILQSIMELGSTVLAKRAMHTLNTLKPLKPTAFQNSSLFRKVMKILESHHYRLTVRRFIIDLFDKDVLRSVVLDGDLLEVRQERKVSNGSEWPMGATADQTTLVRS
ncbi:MAG: hypothetical protein M1829_005980 [Trizodia sp. TS-e1964]|nr:MAG: hypothetical protein M1829_005980 [Trizodia sp. TS-e1964]